MPKSKRVFKVKIHDYDHPPPHCHIYLQNGESYRVTLPMLMEMDGKSLKREIREYLENNIETLIDEWEIKYPQIH